MLLNEIFNVPKQFLHRNFFLQPSIEKNAFCRFEGNSSAINFKIYAKTLQSFSKFYLNYSLLSRARRGLLSRFVSFSENCKIKSEKPQSTSITSSSS